MSQTEEMAKLGCQKEAAEKRAAERYTNMMHANRRAERTEQALEKEKWERLDDQLKAVKLYNVHKKQIKSLEEDVMRAQELQVANTRLTAELAQQKDAATREMISQSSALKRMQAKYEADKQKCMEQTEKEYQKRLAAKEKSMEIGAARQSALLKKATKELESTRRELKQSQQALKWQREQMQQQSAQRAGFHGPQMAAGVHAGFSLPTHAQDKDQARKRRRLNSTGDAGIPTPERQQGFESPISATTPKKKAPGGARQSPQNPSTPQRAHQHSNSNTSSPQVVQQYRTQEQGILLQAQRDGTQQLFFQYASRLNSEREKAGHCPLSVVEAWSSFSQSLAHSNSQQLPRPMSTYGITEDSQFYAHRNTLLTPTMNLGQAGLQPLPIGTSLNQQGFPAVNTQLPLSDQTSDFGIAQQTQQSQTGRPSPQLRQATLPSLEMSNHTFNSMPTLTGGYNATSINTPPDDTGRVQASPPQVNFSDDDVMQFPLLANLNSQLQNGNGGFSLVDSQGTYSESGPVDQSQIPDWVSPTPIHDNNSYGKSNTQASFSDNSVLDSSSDPTHTGFSLATNGSPAQVTDLTAKEASLNARPKQQATDNHPHQMPQLTALPFALDPRLLHSTTPQSISSPPKFPTHNMSPNNPTPSHQRQPSEIPSIISIQSSHPSTSRKTPAASAPASVRSTPAPSGPVFPVCLHCHELWWNGSCDPGEPCQNCVFSGSACERPKCHVEAGTCVSGRCARVHEGDERFARVVVRPKTLKRRGKKEQRGLSPVEVARGL